MLLKRMKTQFFPLLLVLILAMGTMAIVDALPKKESSPSATSVPLTITLFDGAYGDYDGKGYEDDVECYFTVTIANDYNRKSFMTDILLVLPDGTSFMYTMLVSMFQETITFRLLFLNHALVSGDYYIKAEIFLFKSGYVYDWTDILFDPPSERIPDDDPTFMFTVV